MVILIWAVSAVLLVLWSLAGWGLHTLFSLGPGWLDAVPGWLNSLPYPALLERWLPEWRDMLLAGAELAQAVIGWLGAAGVVLVWVVWAGGALALLGLALLLVWAVRVGQEARVRQPSQP